MRIILPILYALVCLSLVPVFGQRGQEPLLSRVGQMTLNNRNYSVSMDSSGRVTTLFDLGRKNQLVVLGTPYWSYPTWQDGSVRADGQVSETSCQVAYNVITNDVLFRFPDDSAIYSLKPASFMIGNARFISQSALGNTYPLYYRVLYQGDSQLLKGFKKKTISVRGAPYGNANLIGYYTGLEEYYYIWLPGQKLKHIQLARQSLLLAMGDNVDMKLLPASSELTVNDVVQVLADYDAH